MLPSLIAAARTLGPHSQALLGPQVSRAKLSQVEQANFPGAALSQETELAQDPCPAQGPWPAQGPSLVPWYQVRNG